MKKTLDDSVEIVRSRLVGRDFKMEGGDKPEHLFCMRLLHGKPRVSVQDYRWFSNSILFGNLETKLMFIDVRKAHFIPVCNEKVFVELSDGRVVRLKKWLYGMRKAASNVGKNFTTLRSFLEN